MTIRYHLRVDASVSGAHAASFEREMLTAQGSSPTDLSSVVGAGDDKQTHLFSTDTNQPNVPD